jgi:hypothetical protein
MIAAVCENPSLALLEILKYYSDLSHLAFGLVTSTKAEEIEIVSRFETGWQKGPPVAAQNAWLVSVDWWVKWRRQDELPTNPPGPICNDSLFLPQNSEIFVFEQRGTLPKKDIGILSVAVSRLSLEYLSDIYGQPTVKICRPIIEGKVDYRVVRFDLYRHKYSQPAESGQTDTVCEKERVANFIKNSRFCISTHFFNKTRKTYFAYKSRSKFPTVFKLIFSVLILKMINK